MKVWTLYRIVFENGKIYFGVTSKALHKRLCEHESAAKKMSRYPIHQAMRRHSNYRIEPLVVGDRDYIFALEEKAIAHFGTRDRTRGYNVLVGGELPPTLTPEVAARGGETRRGRKLTEEQKIAMGLRQRGIPKSLAHRAALSAAHKGKASPRKGANHSEETKIRISLAKLGSVVTESHRAKISASLKGRTKTPEHIAAAAAGRKASMLAKREPK